jgi:S1-C subfamily serine protease
MGMWRKASTGLLALSLFGSTVAAELPTANVIYRVLRIRTAAGTGSAFTVEVDRKQYLITARHNLRQFEGTIEIWLGGRWTRASGRAIYPANAAVDIAALDLGRSITVTYPLEPTANGLALGQQVYFLGYPFGLSTIGSVPAPPGFGEIPFVKSGIVSALDTRNPEAGILYLDGQNNLGFSGGPIVFWHADTGMFRVAGVIGSYRNEALPVLKRKDLSNPRARAHDDLYTRANSGIVIGYDIQHIVDAIEAARPARQAPNR